MGDETIYEIEEIITHRRRPDGKFEYFVKWKGYDNNSNTWEPADNFESPRMLVEYHNSLEGNSISDQLTRMQNAISNPIKRKSSKKTLDPDDLLTATTIKDRNLVPEKVLNIFHVRNDEKDLVAFIRFKNTKQPEFVQASWAHENCPQLVIQFYESRIFWRDKKSGELVKGRRTNGESGRKKQ
ncbi:chromobox protein homolog 3-like [Sitodiplosis mosellana]|uniref:chromobox protein homolog 3-like n=1 Tax=Sitodiplosis mosellana TaxID=263140 RepID=UPI00244422CA|nr:chromobox protein homolog 3-like [Sitodiplosis mosellana]